jgi:hypothetical protein
MAAQSGHTAILHALIDAGADSTLQQVIMRVKTIITKSWKFLKNMKSMAALALGQKQL